MRTNIETLLKHIVRLLFFSLILLLSCTRHNVPDNLSRQNVILVRPTLTHLQNIIYLIENNIITIPDINLIGLYHKSDTYDYKQVSSFLNDNNINYVILKKIDCEIDLKSIFVKNDCSDEYQDYFSDAKGIIFFGGPDIPPVTYNQKNNLLTNSSNFTSQFFELSFLFHLLGRSDYKNFIPLLAQNKNFTVMAICRGMQAMNIATGGTLTQDIPTSLLGINCIEDLCVVDSVNHLNYWTSLPLFENNLHGNFHSINLSPNSFFIQEMDINPNLKPKIMSAHHQCIDKISLDFRPIAHSCNMDIIEAIQHKKYKNVYAVQFHPEPDLLYNNEPVLLKNDTIPTLGKDYLKKHNSLMFHILFWKNFSQKINH